MEVKKGQRHERKVQRRNKAFREIQIEYHTGELEAAAGETDEEDHEERAY